MGAQLAFSFSWDVASHGLAPIELYGSEASIRLPDPNFFGGKIEISRVRDVWEAIDLADEPFGRANFPASGPLVANYRGLGLAEMASAISMKRPHRANGELGLHVLETLLRINEAVESHHEVSISSTVERPALFSAEAARGLISSPAPKGPPTSHTMLFPRLSMTDRPAATDAPAASIDTKLKLTTGADYWTTAAAPELGLRSMRMADGPHGLRVQNDENPDHLGLERSLPATCFPPAVTLASSWDKDLIEKIGRSLALEAKAAGVDIVLGPGLNIKRSPLCGRNFEYYSEDPLLTGVLAGAIARGLQAEGVAACLKHFAVNNQETDRLRVSADVDERALREIYLRAFELALDVSNAWSVMTSYNRINGVYASENPWLLRQVLREEWGFDGLVISDWGAVVDPVASLQAGLDLRMPGRPTDMRPAQAASEGKLAPTFAGEVAERLHRLAERTLSKETALTVDYQAHHEMVREAASQSAVLLTNDGTLPLTLSQGLKVAVIGELARKPRYQAPEAPASIPSKSQAASTR